MFATGRPLFTGHTYRLSYSYLRWKPKDVVALALMIHLLQHLPGLVEVGIYIHIVERPWKLLLSSAWILMVLRRCYLITGEMSPTLPNHPFWKRN